jgi:hypothetical protein
MIPPAKGCHYLCEGARKHSAESDLLLNLWRIRAFHRLSLYEESRPLPPVVAAETLNIEIESNVRMSTRREYLPML